MSKLSPISLTLLRNQELTPHMRRLTLKAPCVADFEQVSAGSYIKLLFNSYGGTDLTQLAESQRPAMRTYSIRALDRQRQTLTLDIVMHGQGEETGPGSNWAVNAQVGEQIDMVGPGHLAKNAAIEEGADWYFLVGDATALPAISTYLEALPNKAEGHALILVKSRADAQSLKAPKGMQVQWCYAQEGNELLTETLRIDWLPGRVAVWVACEFDDMRLLRQYFRNQRSVPHQDIYISSYWRRGKPEDQHVIDKRYDAEAYATSL
ncbi:siderophore-interacting protein [Bowmanella yangjiangensis]|uniref:Siderophore-interacting protein n=1 Tax=Bowmanella yangjiangensis TaxID=2811230 RepID=A0ABS3CVX8_9ALTE|nr:siderophore-interacting protein [Bowmanella yangjiangensis]